VNYRYFEDKINEYLKNEKSFKQDNRIPLISDVLRHHDLGRLSNCFDEKIVPSKSNYNNVSKSILGGFLKTVQDNKIVTLDDIVYYEHLFSFGFQNISNNQLNWINLTNNLKHYLIPDNSWFNQSILGDVDELITPLYGFDDEMCDEFFYFITVLVKNHFNNQGYTLKKLKNGLVVKYNWSVIGFFPEPPSVEVLYKMFYTVCDFQHNRKFLSDNSNRRIEPIDLLF
jgi:hypothetical protein